jgi:hypothetical protein
MNHSNCDQNSPIRAEIADSLTDSDHASIKRRCEQAAKAFQPSDPRQQADGLHSEHLGNQWAHDIQAYEKLFPTL